MSDLVRRLRHGDAVIHGARCAKNARETDGYSIQIDAGRISRVGGMLTASDRCHANIDLTGYLVLPGLINAHDHLQFALYPRLGDPPYGNYVEWGEDIHRKYADVIAAHHRVPKNARLWWVGFAIFSAV